MERLKKFLLLSSLVMLSTTLGVLAQSTGDSPGPAMATGYDQTYINARVAVNGKLLNENDYVFDVYSVGRAYVIPYINGKACGDVNIDNPEGQVVASYQNPIYNGEAIVHEGFYYYSIPVNADKELEGQEIEIRFYGFGNSIYGVMSGVTYSSTPKTAGSLSDPVILNIVTPQIQSPISLNIGETVSLNDKVNYEGVTTVYNWDGNVVTPGIVNIEMMDADYAYVYADRKVNFTITGVSQTPVDSPVHMTAYVNGFNDYPLSFDVNVAPIRVEEISANVAKPFPTALCVGKKVELADDFVVIEPDNATDKSITWTSTNNNVVSIGRYDTHVGYFLNPVSAGTATITATSNDNPEASVSWDVTVYKALESIDFSMVSVYITVDEEFNLYGNIRFTPDASELYDLQASYIVNPDGYEEYLSIDDAGVITGLEPNDNLTVSIMVQDGFGNSASVRVPVVVRNLPTSITFDEPEQNVYPGEALNLRYTFAPENASHFHVIYIDDESVFDFVLNEKTGEVASIKVKEGVVPGTYTLRGQAYDSRYSDAIVDVYDEIIVNVYNELESVAPNTTEVIVVEKGGTIDLKDYVVTSPTDNLFDVKYSFTMVNEGDDEYVRISDDGILEGLNTNGYGVVVVAISAEDGFGNKASSEAWLLVSVHVGVTSLVVPEENVVMWVDEVKYLDELVTVLPEDANYQGLDYTITNLDEGSDEVIVQDEAPNEIGYGHLLAVNPGMARIDVVSEDNENVKGSFIIEVRRHVDGIVGPEDDITVEAFTKVLLDEYITVYPEDAYDKSVTWAVADTTKCIELTQENGSWYVTMKRTGSVPLTVTSNENSDISTMVFVNSTAAVTGIITTADKQILWTNGEPSAVPVSDLYDITPKYATNQDVTWVVNSDDYIIEVWDWSNEYSGAAVKARNVGEASLTLTTKDGGYEGTVEFEVRAHTEYIEMSTEMIEAKVGEVVSLDEVEYSIGPDDAYDKSVTWSVGENSVAGIVEIIEEDGVWSFKALKEGEAILKVATVDNPDNANAYITVSVKLYPTGLVFEEPNQTVYPGELVNVSLSLLPEGVDPSWVDVEWTYDPDVFDFTGEGFMETTEAGGQGISVANYVPDVNVNPEAQPGEYTIYACIAIEGDFEPVPLTVTVPAVVTSITLVDAETESEDIYLTANETRLINIVVEPEDALFELTIDDDGGSNLEILYENPSFDGMEGWTTGEVKLTGSAADGYAIKLTPYMTGEYSLYVRYNYPGNELESGNGEENVHVGAGLSLSDGWNWISTPSAETFPTQSEFAETFGAELEEVRARYSASFKDPTYGFFGTLTAMKSNTAYKLKFDGTPEQYTFYGINNSSVVLKGMDTQLSAGWNWVAYPYEYDYTVDELMENGLFGRITSEAIVSNELTIVAQDGSIGVVSSDGKDITYEGNLETMVNGKCYMVYAPAACNLMWPEVTRLGQRFSVPVRAAGYRTDDISSPFIYDIHQFADVMAMIATVDGLDVPENCIVGAFVDGECRGQGKYSNGKFFIGIHGEQNDVIAFKAYDPHYDLWYDIDQFIQFTSLVGSVKEPARLSTSTITNVDNVLSEKTNSGIYDVTGRRVDVPTSAGVYVTKGKKMLVK